jgi:hypothetical protein
LKQLDFYSPLPVDEPGILADDYSFLVMLYIPDSPLDVATLNTKLYYVTQVVVEANPNFAIYLSSKLKPAQIKTLQNASVK